MSSEIEVCNIALAQIGVLSINSLDEASRAAQLCKLHYPVLRDSLLRATTWNFATRIEPLALTTKEVFDWVFVYSYPINCHKIMRIIPDYETVNSDSGGLRPREALYNYHTINLAEPEYKIFNIDGDRVIASNYENLRAEFNLKVVDPGVMPINFRLALSYLLAMTIAIPLADTKEGIALQRSSQQMYTFYYNQAMIDNANEEQHNEPDSEFIQIRR